MLLAVAHKVGDVAMVLGGVHDEVLIVQDDVDGIADSVLCGVMKGDAAAQWVLVLIGNA